MLAASLSLSQGALEQTKSLKVKILFRFRRNCHFHIEAQGFEWTRLFARVFAAIFTVKFEGICILQLLSGEGLGSGEICGEPTEEFFAVLKISLKLDPSD